MAGPLGQMWPREKTSSGSPRRSTTRPSSTVASIPHMASQTLHVRVSVRRIRASVYSATMSRQTPFFAVLFAGCSTAPVASKPTPPPAPEPVAAAPAVEEWPEIDNALIEQQALTRGFRLGRPSGITLTPEGDAVLFLRTGPRSPVGDLYVTETATGATKKLLSASDLLNGGGEQLSDEEKARRERKRISTRGLVGFDLSDDGRHLLVPLSGRLYVVDRADAVVHELPATAGEPPIDARFSPDARKVAMVRDGDLYVMDVESGKDRRLTTRGSDDVENAVAEFVAQEEMDRREGYWWSPDGKHLVYQHSDLSKVDTLNVSDPANPDHAPVPFRYPRPGRNNADVTLGVIPAAGGKTVWLRWDRERFPYLVRVAWSQNAPLTVMVMNRRQTELVAYAADPKSGDMKELFRETDDAWINLDNDMPKWLPDGSGMLWATERAGWLQLELRGPRRQGGARADRARARLPEIRRHRRGRRCRLGDRLARQPAEPRLPRAPGRRRARAADQRGRRAHRLHRPARRGPRRQVGALRRQRPLRGPPPRRQRHHQAGIGRRGPALPGEPRAPPRAARGSRARRVGGPPARLQTGVAATR
jgi:hypothetical protein